MLGKEEGWSVKSGRERRGGQLSLGERGGMVSKVLEIEDGW